MALTTDWVPGNHDPGHDEREALAATCQTPEHELDALAEEISREIHEVIPEFTSEYHITPQTLEAVRADVAGFLRFMRGELGPEEEVAPPEALAYARAYVHRGISLTTLLRTYRLGHNALWNACAVRIMQSGGEEAQRSRLLIALGDSLFSYIDRLTGRIVDEYQEERRRWVRTADAVRAETVRDLVKGTVEDIDGASRALHYELRRLHIGLALWREEEADSSDGEHGYTLLEQVAVETAERMGGARPLLVPAGRSVLHAWVPVSKDRARGAIERLTRSASRRDHISVAIGDPGWGAEGFRKSHQEALLCRRLMRLRSLPAGENAAYSDMSLYSVLAADLDRAHQLVVRELGPLAAPGHLNGRLRATLLAFYQEGSSPVRAARRLGVHPNTVVHRVGRCEEMLDRPVRPRRLEFEVALVLREALPGADFATEPGG